MSGGVHIRVRSTLSGGYGGHMNSQSDPVDLGKVDRVDRYNIAIDGHRIPANDDQAARVAAMSTEQRLRLRKIMGG